MTLLEEPRVVLPDLEVTPKGARWTGKRPEAEIGFTGTQDGMTAEQKEAIEIILARYTGKFRHGDCIGSDADSHAIARKVGRWKIVIHPPEKDDKRAFCEADELWLPKDYLARNRDIVNNCWLLLATPKEMSAPPETQTRAGGTWYTIRYAQKVSRPYGIIWPDGTTTQQDFPSQQ